jgi:hypothetical protein
MHWLALAIGTGPPATWMAVARAALVCGRRSMSEGRLCSDLPTHTRALIRPAVALEVEPGSGKLFAATGMPLGLGHGSRCLTSSSSSSSTSILRRCCIE